MAIFRLAITPVGRSAGRSATAAAAYRSGERIRDERSKRIHDHSDRTDVLHREILLPARFGAHEASWARDRATLWNTAEHAEKRANSRVAREYQLALPHELTHAQRVELAQNFSTHLAERHSVAVDLAIHAPRPTGDPRNFHAHLLTTTREITATGLGAKTGLDVSFGKSRQWGIVSGRNEFINIRKQWATLTNEALSKANIRERIDHRTLEAQGIAREPRATIPWAAYRMEQQGLHSDVAERVREFYRQKVQARRERHTQMSATPSASLSPRIMRRQSNSKSPNASSKPAHPKSLDELQREAREKWLELRRRSPDLKPEHGREPATERERTLDHEAMPKRIDHDHAL